MSVGGALVWPLVLNDPWIAYPVLFVWGGVFVGVYALMMAVVGGRFAGAELVGIYAVMGFVWGVGALLGPALAGLAMDLSAHGLPIFAALACLAFTIFAATSRSAAQAGDRRADPPSPRVRPAGSTRSLARASKSRETARCQRGDQLSRSSPGVVASREALPVSQALPGYARGV